MPSLIFNIITHKVTVEKLSKYHSNLTIDNHGQTIVECALNHGQLWFPLCHG